MAMEQEDEEAGDPAPNTGVSVPDPGTSVRDMENPALDSEIPAPDAEPESLNLGEAALVSEIPVPEAEIPAAVSESEIPVALADSEIPVPVTEISAPDADSELPSPDLEVASGTETSAPGMTPDIPSPAPDIPAPDTLAPDTPALDVGSPLSDEGISGVPESDSEEQSAPQTAPGTPNKPESGSATPRQELGLTDEEGASSPLDEGYIAAESPGMKEAVEGVPPPEQLGSPMLGAGGWGPPPVGAWEAGVKLIGVPRLEIPKIGEFVYKPAAKIIQDPTLPLSKRPCVTSTAGASVKGAASGSNRQVVELNRQNLLQYKNACSREWQPNPTISLPMRARKWKTSSKLRAPKPVEEWKIREERDKDRRDHELAVELGYETLVGNLLYIDIPGGKDINRSWQSFLSDDLLEWGFPYEKGTFERPRMKQPEPYLAHQVREKLWKYPRTRIFQAAQEDPAQ